MRLRYLKPNQMYCFSPPVMIATFAIEMAMAAYVLYRYKLDAVTRLVVVILAMLALFQVAEYNVCEGAFGMSAATWSRVGYVAITLLPALGIHLILTMAGVSKRSITAAVYGAAAIFASYFTLVAHGMSGHVCMGNYVIFQIAAGASDLYALYYIGLLVTGIGLSLHYAGRAPQPSKARALRSLTAGYLVFMVPTFVVTILQPATKPGIPSIMCGFAVFFGLILVLDVLPQYYEKTSLIRIMYKRFQGES